MTSKTRKTASNAKGVPATLTEALLADGHREALADSCVQLIETRVQGGRGLKGMAFKTGLGVLKSTRPDILPRATRRLLPEFIAAIEPFYANYRDAAGPGPNVAGDFSAFLLQRREAVLQALLGVADAQAAGNSKSAAASFYKKMRGTIESEIDGALPSLTRYIDGELQRAAQQSK